MRHLTKFCGISSIFSESVSFSNSLKIRIDLRAQPAFFLRIGMEKWLSGRKRFFAKEVSLKRVPWVQIPSSPPLFKTRETLAVFLFTHLKMRKTIQASRIKPPNQVISASDADHATDSPQR